MYAAAMHLSVNRTHETAAVSTCVFVQLADAVLGTIRGIGAAWSGSQGEEPARPVKVSPQRFDRYQRLSILGGAGDYNGHKDV